MGLSEYQNPYQNWGCRVSKNGGCRNIKTLSKLGFWMTVNFGGKSTHYCRAASVGLTLLSATTVNLEVLEAVFFGLLSAELNLPIAIFVASGGITHILECDFLVIGLPCV